MSTYQEILSQIESLKKEAEKQRREEVSEAIKAIKKQIAIFGITAEDLQLSTPDSNKSARKGKKTSNATKGSARRGGGTRRKVPPKYRDSSGNTWSGRGKQPKWLLAALASGVDLEALRIKE